MKLIVVRHGQTDWNVEGKIQGRTDIPLNETGLKQAEDVGKKLKDVPIDVIICSPLTRTKQTAEGINKNRERQIPIQYDERLLEQYFGEDEGKNRSEVLFRILEEKRENQETLQDVFNRVIPCIEEIIEKYEDKTVLIVTHGGAIVPIISYFNGIKKLEKGMEIPIIENGAILEYEIQKS